MRTLRIFPILAMLLVSAMSASAYSAEWVDAMKAVHAKGGSQAGSVSQIGDSITYTKAFLSPFAWKSPAGFESVTSRVDRKALNDRKGADNGNYSGWVAAQGLKVIPAVLAKQKPEIAVIMYGTNEISKKVSPADYEKNLTGIIDACLAAGCVPIISTIPPYLNKDAEVQAINDVVKKLAAAKKIPMVDFHAAILERQPGTAWSGTLIGAGDVHPTGGEVGDLSPENLKVSGYALRNFLTLQVMKEVIEQCF
jgi:lysophospholipase L1-like esterase